MAQVTLTLTRIFNMYEIMYNSNGNPTSITREDGYCIPLVVGNRYFDQFLIWNSQQKNPLDFSKEKPIDLLEYKTKKIRDLNAMAVAVVNDSYNPAIQNMFNALFSQALVTGLNNRVAYCSQLLQFGVQVMSAYAAASAAVNQAEKQEQVDEITLDVISNKLFGKNLIDLDPKVTLPEAYAISD